MSTAQGQSTFADTDIAESQAPETHSDNPRPTVSKFADAARDAIDVAEKKGIEAEAMLRESPEQIERRLRAAEARTRSGVEQISETATAYVNEKPMQSLAIAFGAGALVAALLRR